MRSYPYIGPEGGAALRYAHCGSTYPFSMNIVFDGLRPFHARGTAPELAGPDDDILIRTDGPDRLLAHDNDAGVVLLEVLFGKRLACAERHLHEVKARR